MYLRTICWDLMHCATLWSLNLLRNFPVLIITFTGTKTVFDLQFSVMVLHKNNDGLSFEQFFKRFRTFLEHGWLFCVWSQCPGINLATFLISFGRHCQMAKRRMDSIPLKTNSESNQSQCFYQYLGICLSVEFEDLNLYIKLVFVLKSRDAFLLMHEVLHF
jgi:hypothetical protein